MPTTAIGTSLPFGYAGTVAYSGDRIIEKKSVNSASANIPFGAAVIQNADNSVSFSGSTLTATNFAGVAVAEDKQMLTYPIQNGSVNGFYAPLQPCDIVERGIVSVICQRGTPTNTSGVYVRTVANGSFPTAVVGGFEASSDGSNSVQLTNCSWNGGGLDAFNVASLKIKSINT